MNISEKTIKTALVNYKCVGYFGKCFTHFSKRERAYIVHQIVDVNNWLTNDMIFTTKGNKVAKENLHLCQY